VAIDPTDVQAFRLAVGRIGRRLRQLYVESDGQAISPLELTLLVRLRQEGTLSPGVVARAERVTSQAVAIALRRLTERGLVARTPDTVDRRRVVVTVTTQGQAYLALRDEAMTGPLADALAQALTPEERAQLSTVVNLLERVAAALRAR
jgi:DNA-binding MarR family transcriptional regulator